jgi:hypothetical protein
MEMKNMNPKIILSAIAVAALIATPAFAKARKHSTENVPAQLYNSTAPVSGNAVVAPDGRVIGADPSAEIRGDLVRDSGMSEGAF